MNKSPHFGKIERSHGCDIDDREHEYTLKIFVDPGDEEVSFDLAMSLSSGLNISQENTPFECTFTTRQYYIFYEAAHRRSRITAEIHGDEFGTHMKLGAHSGGDRGKLIRDPIKGIGGAGSDGY